jgi:hypothetical protein
MTQKRPYTTIIEFEVNMSEGVFLQMSDGTERHFDIEEFQDFLEETQDLEDFTFDQGDWYDDGDSHSPAMTIDWQAAIEHYKAIEIMNKFYNSHNNLILQ